MSTDRTAGEAPRTKLVTPERVAKALQTLPRPAYDDEAVVTTIAEAYARGDLVLREAAAPSLLRSDEAIEAIKARALGNPKLSYTARHWFEAVCDEYRGRVAAPSGLPLDVDGVVAEMVSAEAMLQEAMDRLRKATSTLGGLASSGDEEQ